MNKGEILNELHNRKDDCANQYNGNTDPAITQYWKGHSAAFDYAIGLVEDFAPTIKAELTQDEARWLEKRKESHLSICDVLDICPQDKQTLFARAYLDGYTISSEPLYCVHWEWFLNPVELNEEEAQLLEWCRQSGGVRQLVNLLPDD